MRTKWIVPALLAALLLAGCGDKKVEKAEIMIPPLTEAPETEAAFLTEAVASEAALEAETAGETEQASVSETDAATEETVPSETETSKVMGKVIKVESLNVREGPSVNTKIVKKLHLNDEVTIEEGIVLDSVQWAHIEGGWVCLDY